MSERGFEPPPPQRDDLPARKVLLGLAALLTLFSLTVAATLPLERRGAPQRVREVQLPPDFGRPEVGLVDQEPFSMDRRARERRERQQRVLSTYGWVDREAGVIHVPVDRAVELLLQQQREGRRD
jgi:hypothetical protein